MAPTEPAKRREVFAGQAATEMHDVVDLVARCRDAGYEQRRWGFPDPPLMAYTASCNCTARSRLQRPCAIAVTGSPRMGPTQTTVRAVTGCVRRDGYGEGGAPDRSPQHRTLPP